MDFVTGFLGGVVVVAGALLLLARVILTSPVLLRAVEALANSWPAEVREMLNTWGRLVVEATNNVPDVPDSPDAVTPKA